MSLNINGLNARNVNTQQARGSQSTTSAGDEKASGKDVNARSGSTVKISADAQSLQQVHSDVKAESAVDAEKVASIKAAINSGSYTPDAHRIAGKMLDQDSLY